MSLFPDTLSKYTWRRPAIQKRGSSGSDKNSLWSFNNPSVKMHECTKIDVSDSVYLVRIFNTKERRLTVDLRYNKENKTMVILVKDKGLVFMTMNCDYFIDDISSKLEVIERAYKERLNKATREACV